MTQTATLLPASMDTLQSICVVSLSVSLPLAVNQDTPKGQPFLKSFREVKLLGLEFGRDPIE